MEADPRTGRVRVVYDFDQPAQMRDFYAPGKHHVGGGMFTAASMPRHGLFLQTNRFDIERIDVKITYRSRHREWVVFPYFGTEVRYGVYVGKRKCSLRFLQKGAKTWDWMKRAPLAEQSQNLGGNGVIEFRKRGDTFTVRSGDRTILEAKAKRKPTGNRVGLIGLQGHFVAEIHELEIRAALNRAWLRRAVEPPAKE
jgi:hypothetical protein